MQTWNPSLDPLVTPSLPLSREPFPTPLTCSLRTTFPRKSSWPLSFRTSLKILFQAGCREGEGPGA